jgi:hypothetical protein
MTMRIANAILWQPHGPLHGSCPSCARKAFQQPFRGQLANSDTLYQANGLILLAPNQQTNLIPETQTDSTPIQSP